MRKLTLVALMAGVCFLGISSVASATSVDLVWTGASSGVVSGNSVTLDPETTATLTLDVQLDIDSRGVAGVFLSIHFDSDLGNEVNVLSRTELEWTLKNAMGMTQVSLKKLGPGVNSSQESTGGQEGQMFTFEGTSLGMGPESTTLTFARIVFSTNVGATTDGNDIFSGVFEGQVVGGNDPGSDITSSVSFGGASVNVVPEPGTITLLGLGVGALVLAGRRRGRK